MPGTSDETTPAAAAFDLAAALRRAQAAGIDPQRVLVALGIDLRTLPLPPDGSAPEPPAEDRR